MADLFGNPDRMEARQESAPSSVSLFDATAERIAYEGGRNVAQVAIELKNGDQAPYRVSVPSSHEAGVMITRFYGTEADAEVAAAKWGGTIEAPTPTTLPSDGLFVVGATTWGFDANGKYRTMPTKAPR